MSERVRFKLPERNEVRGVEDDVALAIFTAECIYGRPQTRMEVSYATGLDGRTCVLDVNGPAGESAVRVLVGLFEARFGEARFAVERGARP